MDVGQVDLVEGTLLGESQRHAKQERGGHLAKWIHGALEHMTSRDGDKLEAAHALIALYQQVDSVKGMPLGKRQVMQMSDDAICHLSRVLVGCWASQFS